MEIRDNRSKEWFWLDNKYLNGYAKILGINCTVVYLSLCRHADNQTQTCFPSMKLIAEENAISERSVIRATKILEEWRIIKIVKNKKKDGTQANNIYTLTSKNVWKSKPSDSQSPSKPSDSDDISRVTHSHNNKTQVNKTHISETSSQEIINKKNKNKKMKNTFKYNEQQHTDRFDDVIDYETGEPIKAKEPSRQKAINYIKDYHREKCEKLLKVTPIYGSRENIFIANLFNKNKFKPTDLTEMLDWYFLTQKDKSFLVNIKSCLSNYTINLYRVQK